MKKGGSAERIGFAGQGADDMEISVYGILFVVSIILLLILISIQFTLNQILKELRILKNRMSYRNEDADSTRLRRP